MFKEWEDIKGGMETWKWKRCDRKKEGHKEEGKTRQ